MVLDLLIEHREAQKTGVRVNNKAADMDVIATTNRMALEVRAALRFLFGASLTLLPRRITCTIALAIPSSAWGRATTSTTSLMPLCGAPVMQKASHLRFLARHRRT